MKHIRLPWTATVRTAPPTEAAYPGRVEHIRDEQVRWLNMGEYLSAADTYMRLALRAQAQAQAQSRATVETMATIKQGPAVFARSANVVNGPQQGSVGAAQARAAPMLDTSPPGIPLPQRVAHAGSEATIPANEVLRGRDGERLDT